MPATVFQTNFRTLDLNLLRVFDEVMAERSLTRAARNLSLTQPAVSNALRRLREALGDELVRRSGAGMEPTPLALALWPSVREALLALKASLAPGTFDPAMATSTLCSSVMRSGCFFTRSMRSRSLETKTLAAISVIFWSVFTPASS